MLLLSLWISLTLSITLVPIIRWFSFRVRLVAHPRSDRWHTKPTPKLGGLVIYLSFSIAIGINTLIQLGGVEQAQWGLITGASLIFLLGLFDDLKPLTPTTKLVGQILAAAIVISFGRNIGFFSIEILNLIFTFIWLVGITNAINLLDNMDGLASGVALIASGLLSVLFWQAGRVELLYMSLGLAGSTLGFLIFNFPPASIFMGDSGSMFLGFTLAALAIARVPRASNVLAVLGVPTMLFLLPILDTTLVTFTRILRGQSPTHGGKDHTSHRLIAFGFNERQAVLILYGVAILSGVTGTVLESLDYGISLVLVPIFLIALTLFTAYLGRLKVVSPSSASSSGAFTRLMIRLTMKGRLLEVILDFFLIGIAYYLAFLTRFGLTLPEPSMESYLLTLPITLVGSYLSFFTFGIYRGVWQYIGLGDLIRQAIAVFGAVIISDLIIAVFYSRDEISLAISLLFAIFLFLGLAISRSSFRILDQVYDIQTRIQQKDCPILIYGADDLGEITLRWILQKTDLNYRPVGFLDEDPFKFGRKIHGIEVLGDINSLESVLEQHPIEGVIFPPVFSSSTPEMEQILAALQKKGIWAQRLRVDFEPLE